MTDKASEEVSATPRIVMAAVWGSMGAACMLAPDLVGSASFKNWDKEATPLAKVVFRCFGAQAVMVGLLMSQVKMSPSAHRVWAGAVSLFYIFDYMAWERSIITDFGALGDAAGNAVFIACSAAGAGGLPALLWWEKEGRKRV